MGVLGRVAARPCTRNSTGWMSRLCCTIGARGRADTPRGMTRVHAKLYCRANFLTHKSACLNIRIPTAEELTVSGQR